MKFVKATSIALCVLSSIGIQAQPLDNTPPGGGIKNLQIFSYDGQDRTTIYANGNMQAAFDIVYELAPDHVFKSAVLKKYNTEESLASWVQSSTENQYLHSINSSMRSISARSRNIKKIYLSRNTPASVEVCVELTATKNGVDSIKSTCIPGSANASVYVSAIAPKYLTKDNFELTDWGSATPINKYVAPSTGTWSNEIREQVLRSKGNAPTILSIESDNLLQGGTSALFVNKSLVSKYIPEVAPSGVSHIMSWVALPSKVNKIDFVENVGLNEYWGYTLRRTIPYYFKDDPTYVFSLVTYVLRDDKFLYDHVYNHYALCGEKVGNNNSGVRVRDCQVRGNLAQKAPVYGYSQSQINSWKVERLKGSVNVIDWYGTKSQLNFGVKYMNDVYSDIVLE